MAVKVAINEMCIRDSVYTKSIYKSLCNLNMVVDIFTLSLNADIYNEGKHAG